MKRGKMRRNRLWAVVVLMGTLLAATAVAQQPPQSGEVKKVPTPGIPSTGFAGLDQYRSSRVPMLLDDYGQLARYRTADEELLKAGPVKDRVVFFGDSITDNWKLEQYFAGKPYVNRGIGGQTTPQMLVRFRQDAIALQPKAVVILAGTNEIGGNTGPKGNEEMGGGLATMAELAKAHGTAEVFASILPVHNYTPRAADFFAQRPGARILELNRDR